MPAGFFLNWVVALFPGSFLPAALVILAMQLVTSLAVLALLRRCLDSSPGILVGLTVYLFTPLTLPTTLWWAAATQAIPLQLATALAGYSLIRYRESHQRGWVAVSLAALVMGILFWEKAILIPVFLVLMVVLLEGSLRRAPRALWQLRGVWTLQAVVVLAYTAVYLALSPTEGEPVESFADLVRVVRFAGLETFVVGVLGGPWTGEGLFPTGFPNPGPVTELVSLQAVLAVLVLAYGLRGRSSLLGVGIMAVYLSFDIALLAWGRGYWGGYLSRDPRYIADALPLAALVTAYLFTPAARPERPAWGSRVSQRIWVVVGVAVVLVFNSSMVSNYQLAPPLQHRSVGEYVAEARKAVAEDSDLILYDGPVPESAMLATFGEPAHVSTVLGAYDVHPTYNVPSEDMRMLNNDGEPRSIRLVFEQRSVEGEVESCGTPVDPGASVRIPFKGKVAKGTWILRLDYFTAADGAAQVRTSKQSVRFPLDAGLHSSFMVIDGPFSSLELDNVGEEAVVCMSEIVVGLPVPTDR